MVRLKPIAVPSIVIWVIRTIKGDAIKNDLIAAITAVYFAVIAFIGVPVLTRVIAAQLELFNLSRLLRRNACGVFRRRYRRRRS